MATFYLIVGLLVLVLGAELLVRGASRLSLSFGIAPLVVGLTVVAFGTSAPEAAVSIGSVFQGNADISIGNVVGSNIFNVLFILGVAALIRPLTITQQIIKKETPLMIGVSLLLVVLLWNGFLGRLEGTLLFLGIIFYTFWTVRQSKKESKQVQQEYSSHFEENPTQPKKKNIVLNTVFVLLGLALLVFGANWVVDGASTIARYFGVSDLIIGLTIVAGGTSLPELATSVLASFKKESDIAVGNVVGSNIFNILSILGLVGILAPQGLNVNFDLMSFDFIMMVGCAILCVPFFFTNNRVTRLEGLGFLVIYVLYVVSLVASSNQSPAAENLKLITVGVMAVFFVLSLVSSIFQFKKTKFVQN